MLREIPDVIKHTPDMPPRLRFMLTHPRAALAILALTYPCELVHGAWIGVRESHKHSSLTYRTFLALTRHRDAL